MTRDQTDLYLDSIRKVFPYLVSYRAYGVGCQPIAGTDKTSNPYFTKEDFGDILLTAVQSRAFDAGD